MADGVNANAEWRLSDFLDALAAEVDRTQDTLALKSFGRGMTVAVQGLTLDLAVQARVDEKGQIFFRSAEAGQPSPTILKINLREVFQSQLEEVRRPLDDEGDLGLPLSSLPEITAAEIETLQAISVFTVEDLRRYCRTPALLSEVSRRTGMTEARLRGWLGLPFFTGIEPPAGAPGQVVALAGGNLGMRKGDDAVLFQQLEAPILGWEESRVTVEVPPGAVAGPVYGRIDGARTNVLLWQVQPARMDLQLRDLALEPPAPTAKEEILFSANLANAGDLACGPFAMEWSIDGARALLSDEPGLAPGHSSRFELRQRLAPGPHQVRATADPEGRLPLVDRGRATLERTFTVAAPPPQIRLLGLDPAGGAVGGTLTVTLQGQGFQQGVAVSFGAGIQIGKITVESPQAITVQISVAAQAAPGPRDVTVTLASGAGSDTLRAGFMVSPRAPAGDLAVTSLVPDRARAGIIQTVTVHGRGFQPNVSISFGRGFIVHMERISSERLALNLTIPAQARGPLTLTVMNPDGSTISVPGAFQVLSSEGTG